jgi:hypothetical protein
VTSRDVFRAKGAFRRLTLSAIIYPHVGCALSSHSICTLTPSCHSGAVVFARSRPFSFLSFRKRPEWRLTGSGLCGESCSCILKFCSRILRSGNFAPEFRRLLLLMSPVFASKNRKAPTRLVNPSGLSAVMDVISSQNVAASEVFAI